MTQEEQIICNLYLDDLDKMHTCNEYKLLKEMLNDQMPSPKSKRLMIGMLVLLIMTFIFGIGLHISCLRALQAGRNGAALNDYIFGLIFIAFSASNIYGKYLHEPLVKWLFSISMKRGKDGINKQ